MPRKNQVIRGLSTGTAMGSRTAKSIVFAVNIGEDLGNRTWTNINNRSNLGTVSVAETSQITSRTYGRLPFQGDLQARGRLGAKMKRIFDPSSWFFFSLMFMLPAAGAAELLLELDVSTVSTSNVFLDQSTEWDTAIQPSIEMALDFSKFWSSGYRGQLNAYLQHESLRSHWHELYLFANPAWGVKGENELVVELSAEILRNQEEFQELNLLEPALLVKLAMEPYPWLRYELSTQLAYRRFSNDRPSDSLDAWALVRLSFTLPSRTTLSPRIACGFRFYPHQDPSVVSEDQDHQLKWGLHASQALWKQAGLQLDYAYLWALDTSGLLERKLTQAQFSYLGENFLYSGHVIAVGLKQILGSSFTLGFHLRFEQRTYAGWMAIDASGTPKGEDRTDQRLIPRAYLSWVLYSKPRQAGSWIPELGLQLDYRTIRQWSNSDWYDTLAHLLDFSLWASW